MIATATVMMMAIILIIIKWVIIIVIVTWHLLISDNQHCNVYVYTSVHRVTRNYREALHLEILLVDLDALFLCKQTVCGNWYSENCMGFDWRWSLKIFIKEKLREEFVGERSDDSSEPPCIYCSVPFFMYICIFIYIHIYNYIICIIYNRVCILYYIFHYII